MNSSPRSASSGMGKLTQFLARTIAYRTKTLIFVAFMITAISIIVLVTRKNLDSEILDLLPPSFESVNGLKKYNSEFAQARQMVFGFLGEEGHADDVDSFKSHFMSELAKEPWVLRTFDRIPLDTPEGL